MIRYALALAAMVVAGPALAQDTPQCELDRPVVFGSLNWDSAQFHGAVAEYIIKNG
jgi:glycine betaine/proline transport system substrate-binding protein